MPRAVIELVDPDTAVVLGHRRLSIIDLSSAADQPFAKDGLTLTYNGELYNYRELRRELEAGVPLRHGSDTEVVLEAWRAWGPRCLRRFRGCSRSRSTTSAPGASRSPGTRSASSRSTSCRGVAASCSPPSSRRSSRPVGPELGVDPAAMVASTLYYWLPQEFDAVRGVHRHPAGTWSEYHRDGSVGSGRFWDTAAEAALAAPTGRRPTSRGASTSVEAHLVADAPGGVVPQRWPRLEHRHRARASQRPVDRGLHDRLPAGGPAARGDARRRPLRPAHRRPPRDPAARDRDPPRRRRHAPAHGRHPRRADRRTRPRSTPCSCATPRATPGSRCCSRGWAPTSSSAATASTWRCSWPRATAGCRAVRAAVAPAVRALPPSRSAVAGCAPSAGPSASSPSPSCPRRRPSGAATPSTTATSSPDLLDPDLPATSTASWTDTASLRRQRPRRPREPDVPGGHPDVHAWPQPHLHRPGEHGRLHRGPGAVRRPGGHRRRRSRSPPPRRSAAGSRRPRSRTPRGPGCPTRSSTAPRRASVRPCGPG